MGTGPFAGCTCVKRDGFDLMLNAGSTAILGQVRKTGLKIVTILGMDNHIKESYTQDLTEPAYQIHKLSPVDFYYGDMLTLQKYHLDDARVLTEYVQEDSMGGTNLIFIALRDESTGEPVPETVWPKGISYPEE